MDEDDAAACRRCKVEQERKGQSIATDDYGGRKRGYLIGQIRNDFLFMAYLSDQRRFMALLAKSCLESERDDAILYLAISLDQMGRYTG